MRRSDFCHSLPCFGVREHLAIFGSHETIARFALRLVVLRRVPHEVFSVAGGDRATPKRRTFHDVLHAGNPRKTGKIGGFSPAFYTFEDSPTDPCHSREVDLVARTHAGLSRAEIARFACLVKDTRRGRSGIGFDRKGLFTCFCVRDTRKHETEANRIR